MPSRPANPRIRRKGVVVAVLITLLLALTMTAGPASAKQAVNPSS